MIAASYVPGDYCGGSHIDGSKDCEQKHKGLIGKAYRGNRGVAELSDHYHVHHAKECGHDNLNESRPGNRKNFAPHAYQFGALFVIFMYQHFILQVQQQLSQLRFPFRALVPEFCRISGYVASRLPEPMFFLYNRLIFIVRLKCK